jgi:peroxiredoxin
VLIKERRLLARAVFGYIETGPFNTCSFVKEITEEPGYEAILPAISKPI